MKEQKKIIHPISGKNKKIAEKAAELIARDYGEVIRKLANT